MVGWIVGKLKWLLVICAVGGPIVAVSCWFDGERRREVMAQGVETVADVDGATRVKRRRSGTTYKVHLSWADAAGVRHKVEDVSISPELARQIIDADRLTVDTLPIKYISTAAVSATKTDGARPASENVIILPDTAHQEQTDRELVYVGAGAGVVGLIGSALIFLPRRRRRQAVAA